MPFNKIHRFASKLTVKTLCLLLTPARNCNQALLMERAYEGDNMRARAKKTWLQACRSINEKSIDPWEYDKELYKRRNKVERFFRRIKRFRLVFTRYDKLGTVFAGFILFAMIVNAFM